MVTPKRSGAFPTDFLRVVEHVMAGNSPHIIPTPSIKIRESIRFRLYGLFRALRNEGKPEYGDAIQISTDGNNVVLTLREQDRDAQIIRASMETPADTSDTVFEKLLKGPTE